MLRSIAKGAGAYLPENRVTNDDLSKIVDTSDEWIQARTGIKARHLAAEGEFTSHLAIAAAKNALADANMDASEIDLIVMGTTTPDQTFPSTASRVQAALGITQGAAFDVQAVCSGFVFALATADNFIKAGQYKNCLVIGAETMSRIIDWEDRGTCVLFGDGAGAIVLQAGEGNGTNADQGVLTTYIRTDGRHGNLLYVDGGPSSTQTVGHLRMAGKDVFKHAVINIADAIVQATQNVGIEVADVDWFVPHQANQRILAATAKRLSIPDEKVIVTVAEHGNTSAASVPLAFVQGISDGRIKRGDLVLFEAMGGGFTWGSALLRW